MKVILSMVVMLVLSGCVALKPNPKFSQCANSCSAKQDVCMVKISTAKEMGRCNLSLEKCMKRCNGKYTRYLK